MTRRGPPSLLYPAGRRSCVLGPFWAGAPIVSQALLFQPLAAAGSVNVLFSQRGAESPRFARAAHTGALSEPVWVLRAERVGLRPRESTICDVFITQTAAMVAMSLQAES